MRIEEIYKDHLQWFPELEIGFFQVREDPIKVYNRDYFEKIKQNSQTEIGIRLNTFRQRLVNHFVRSDKQVLDIGVGSGQFVMSGSNYYGFDINKVAIDFLLSKNKYSSPYTDLFYAMTFWDSLEHIKDPTLILKNVEKYAFVSCPIYKSEYHILDSKHYRKDEHFWYWTVQGLQNFMKPHGFKLIQSMDTETLIGREDIQTFIFEKIN